MQMTKESVVERMLVLEKELGMLIQVYLLNYSTWAHYQPTDDHDEFRSYLLRQVVNLAKMIRLNALQWIDVLNFSSATHVFIKEHVPIKSIHVDVSLTSILYCIDDFKGTYASEEFRKLVEKLLPSSKVKEELNLSKLAEETINPILKEALTLEEARKVVGDERGWPYLGGWSQDTIVLDGGFTRNQLVAILRMHPSVPD
jgi:hypothetical protein